MKKGIFLFLVLAIVGGFGVSKVFSQVTEPPLTLPIDSTTATDTVTSTTTATASTSVTRTATPTATATASVASIVEDAETGSNTYVLIAISVLGGLGLFSIKKHFDNKRFSL